jgi:predicted HicB family RNase H-like nuclease
MSRNSSYHLAEIESSMDITHLTPSDQTTFPGSDGSLYRSVEVVLEIKGNCLEVSSDEDTDFLIGRIRTPSGRLRNNFCEKSKDVESLKEKFRLYLEEFQRTVESKFRQDLSEDKISGKIALRIDPKLHCDLKIESTLRDTTLNSYIQEIARQRVIRDDLKPSTISVVGEQSKSNELQPQQNVDPGNTLPHESRKSIFRQLTQSPKASSKMISSLAEFAKEDEFDFLAFSKALEQFVNGMGESLSVLSPHLKANEENDPDLLKALGNMLIEASDAL